MKYLKLTVIILFTLLSTSTQTSAHGYMGASNIEYEWLKDSTYRIYFKNLRPCGGASVATTVDLCIFNSCTNTTSTVQMSLVTGNIKDNNFINGYALGITCTPNNTNCYGKSAPGVREYWYATTITLPQMCTNWKFSVHDVHRHHTNNIDQNTAYYMEANLYTNNVNLPQPNTTPYFLSSGYMVVASNQVTTYNLGAIDIDGDSLSYSVVSTKHSNGCGNAPTNATYVTENPTLQAPNNPLQCNNTFTIDNKTGTAKFTAAPAIGAGFVTFLIEEYRDGILIGSLLRDVSFTVAPNTIPQPAFVPDQSSLSGATFSSNRLNGCIDQQMSMCFDIKSNNTSARFILSDNHQAIIPGSQILYYNQNSDSVRGCMGWKPSLANAGLHTMIVDILDTSCVGNLGLLFNRQAIFEVFIAPPVKTNKDMIVCVNEPVQLTASGGWGTYNWQVLSGSPNSLSCTNCAMPIATPGVKTTYRVSSSNGICAGDNYYADTITIDVHNAVPTNPTINITASPSGKIQPGTSVSFTANTTACNNPEYQWMKNGSVLTGASANTWTSQLLNDQDRITCQLTCADTCPKPRVQVSNIITVLTDISVVKKQESNTKIYPNPNDGSFIIETELDVTQSIKMEVLNTFGQTVYADKLNTRKQQINLRELAAGIYFLKIISQPETQSIQFIKK